MLMQHPALRLDVEQAARTQEISAADILEETPIGRDGVPSVWPVSLTPAAPEATFTLQIPKKSLRGLVLGGLCATSIILFLAAFRFATGEPTAEAPPPLTQAAAALPLAGTPKSAPTVAVPEGLPAAPPPAQQADSVVAGSGTITSPGARWPLVVDGKRISTPSAMVSCGRHTIRVGRSKSREVLVPCGATVQLDETGRPQ
jgi:hypothetical protein